MTGNLAAAVPLSSPVILSGALAAHRSREVTVLGASRMKVGEIADHVLRRPRERMKQLRGARCALTADPLMEEAVVGTSSEIVLTNAVYFKAAWNEPFKEEETTDGEFTRLDGSKVTARMMHQVVDLNYSEGEGYAAVEIPYDGEQLSMVVIVPDQGEFEEFEISLDRQGLDEILADLAYKQVTLSLPKFKFEFGSRLKQVLSDLGMDVAFSNDADFSGITEEEKLVISDVLHKTFVAVNEAGTEAAAATAVVFEGSGIPDEVTLSVDRPFLFLIRDIPTGAILFIGRVLDPTAS